MVEVYKHIKTAFKNRYAPNNLSYFDYFVDAASFLIFAFFLFNQRFYRKIENNAIVEILNLSEYKYYFIILGFCIIILLIQGVKIMPEKDVVLYRFMGFDYKALALIIILRFAPFLTGIIRIGFYKNFIFGPIIIATFGFSVLICLIKVYHLGPQRNKPIISKFCNKTTAFVFGELFSNISGAFAIIQFALLFIITIALGRKGIPPIIALIIIVIIVYSLLSDVFFKKENNIVLYRIIGLTKVSHLKYVMFFSSGQFVMCFMVYLFNLESVPIMDAVICLLYGGAFIAGFSALRVARYSKGNGFIVGLLYLILFFIPIFPLIVLIKGIRECKKNSEYI